MSVVIRDGAPVVLDMGNGRRYTVCDETVRHPDGEKAGWCGNLIDVTNKQIRADAKCGDNHIWDDGPVIGF